MTLQEFSTPHMRMVARQRNLTVTMPPRDVRYYKPLPPKPFMTGREATNCCAGA